jgi:outer membrane protein OmpA-like peptidoglycan-associated protein
MNRQNYSTFIFLLLISISSILSAQENTFLFAKGFVYYSSGSNNLDQIAVSALDSILSKSENFTIHKINIRSHTDSIGDMSENIKLSERRSNEVKKFLIQKGISSKIIRVENFGSVSPLADNHSESGRQLNRCTAIEFYSLQNQISLTGILKDSETKQPIADSMVLIFNKEKADTFFTDKNGQFNATINAPETISTLDIFVKDYFFESVDIDQTKANLIRVNMPLKKAKKGNKAMFDNINFNPGSAIMLSNSHKILDKIVRFLKYNPSKEIEIGGHVNVPNQAPVSENSEDFKLSVSRANRVKVYFSEKGIKADRMTSKGYGSSFMLYPKAVTEAEQIKNRRVEIVITKE